MLSRQFIRLAREQGWEVQDDRIAGEIDEVLFTILDSERGQTLILYLPQLMQATREKLEGFVASNRRRLRLRELEMSEDFYFLRFRSRLFVARAEDFATTLATLVGLIREEESVQPICAVCGELCDDDERGYYLELYVHAHAACLADTARDESEASDADDAGAAGADED